MVLLSVFAIAAAIAGVSAVPSEYEALEARANSPPACSEKSPYPSGSVCQTRGTLSKPAVLKTLPANKYGGQQYRCFDICAKTSGCLLVGFDESDSDNYATCTLYSKTAKQMGFASDDSANVFYWSINCFTCVVSKNCKPTLANGGFESGSLSPWGVGGDGATGAIVQPGAGGSANAAAVTIPPAEGGFSTLGQLNQLFVLCKGKKYTVSFSYKYSGAGTTPLLFLRNDYQNGGSTIITASDISTEWQSKSVTITTTDYHADANFLMYNPDQSNSVTVYIDNVKVVKAT